MAVVQPLQRVVEGRHQRRHFAGHVGQRQAHAALVGVDLAGARRCRVQTGQRAPHHEVRCQQRGRHGDRHDRQHHLQQQQQHRQAEVAPRDGAVGAGEYLHLAGGRIDPAHARGLARRVTDVPAQPRLPHLVERVADARELGRDAAFHHLPPLCVAHREPQPGLRPAQRGKALGRPHREAAVGFARHGLLQDLDRVLRRAEVDQLPRRRERADHHQLYRHLQQHQLPDQPPLERRLRALALRARAHDCERSR